MSRTYKRITADLDPERGNAVTIRREDVAPLVKTLPTEVTAPIIDAFIRWFCNVAEPEIKDAIARAILDQFKERQRVAVKNYIADCDSKSPHKAIDADGERRVGTTIDKPLNKEKVKNEVNEVNTSVLYGDASVTPSGGDSTPTASPPTAVVGSAISKQDIIDARATVARYAPEPKFVLAFDPTDYDPNGDEKEIDCKTRCDDETRRKCKLAADKGKLSDGECWLLSDCYWIDKRAVDSFIQCNYDELFCVDPAGGKQNKFWRDYCKARYSSCAKDFELRTILWKTIEESETERGKAAVARFRDTLGETFKRAVWTFYIQANAEQLPENDADGNASNYGKLLFGRLKKLVEAKAILAQVDETRQRSMPPPPTPPRSAQ